MYCPDVTKLASYYNTTYTSNGATCRSGVPRRLQIAEYNTCYEYEAGTEEVFSSPEPYENFFSVGSVGGCSNNQVCYV